MKIFNRFYEDYLMPSRLTEYDGILQAALSCGYEVHSVIGFGKILSEEQIYVEKLFTYQEAGKIQLIREYGQLLSEEYTDTGILVKARVPQEIHGKLM